MSVRWVTERSVMRTFDGDVVDACRRANALQRSLMTVPGVTDCVAGARSVLVMLENDLTAAVEELLRADIDPRADNGTTHEIICRYDGEDLAAVARAHSMGESDVIRTHSGAVFTVGFVGFSPGFAYLLGLPTQLHTPRLATPRARVEAGSIGIGGEYTGVYPSQTPGGWNIIGHTDATLFDPHAQPPARLQPGDRVRFVPA